VSLRHTSCFYIIVLLVRVCASRWRRLKIDALIGLVEEANLAAPFGAAQTLVHL